MIRTDVFLFRSVFTVGETALNFNWVLFFKVEFDPEEELSDDSSTGWRLLFE
jgi:hypothetical protein